MAPERQPAPGLGADAFEVLAAAEAPRLLRFARSLARDAAAAEDLVQETLARGWERRASFRGDSAPATWLHRILHNLAVDRARRHAHEVVVADVEERWRDDAYTVDAAAVVERAQSRAELEDALVRLPFAYRSAVVLHDAEGWTAAEIADRLGIGLPAAKQRLRRGRMLLVTALASGAERREVLKGVPMRCWDARSLVSDYLDGGLDDERRARLERHLAACPTCPPLLASAVGLRAALGDLRDPDAVVPPALAERLAAGARGRRESRHRPQAAPRGS
ncbi:MAG TPA: sigma-70 family RNA polymerase sigma factor [Gaiellaceae bacterium]|nr:sigma-70 family RNA polymerase sigma factor [Gaiellaceae bacterium]